MCDIGEVYNAYKHSVFSDGSFLEVVFAKNTAYFADIGVYVDRDYASVSYLEHALAHDFVGFGIEIIAAQVCQLDKCYGICIRRASF